MKVWIVEPVGYNQYGIMGVYDSLEAAKAAFPEERWIQKGASWESEGASAVSECGYSIYSDDVGTLTP